jgi:hypothetical protein
VEIPNGEVSRQAVASSRSVLIQILAIALDLMFDPETIFNAATALLLKS